MPTARATSLTAIGWISIGDTRTVSPSVAAAVMLSMNSKNCVARTIEVAGPKQYRLDALTRTVLAAKGDRHQVIADVHARYYGAELSDLTLTPSDHPRFAPTRFEDWFTHSLARA